MKRFLKSWRWNRLEEQTRKLKAKNEVAEDAAAKVVLARKAAVEETKAAEQNMLNAVKVYLELYAQIKEAEKAPKLPESKPSKHAVQKLNMTL